MHFTLPNFPQTQPANPKSQQVSESPPPSVSPPTTTTHLHRCSVDRATSSPLIEKCACFYQEKKAFIFCMTSGPPIKFT